MTRETYSGGSTYASFMLEEREREDLRVNRLKWVEMLAKMPGVTVGEIREAAGLPRFPVGWDDVQGEELASTALNLPGEWPSE